MSSSLEQTALFYLFNMLSSLEQTALSYSTNTLFQKFYMNTLFQKLIKKLPIDIIKNICQYLNICIRNNEIVSLIVKNDYRYDILKHITIKRENINKYTITSPYHRRNKYTFHNLYDFVERKEQNIEDDTLEVLVTKNTDNSIKYEVYCYRLKLIKDIFETNQTINNPFDYYRGNLTDYSWYENKYEYTIHSNQE